MTTEQSAATLLIVGDIGRVWGTEQIAGLAVELERRLNQRVVVCSADDETTSLANAIHELVTSGVKRLVVLPLGLLPVSAAPESQLTLHLAREQWPQLRLQIASPLSWVELSGWLRATAVDTAPLLKQPPQDVAVLLVGENISNSLVNADLARLSYLMLQDGPLGAVGYAFLGAGRPEIPEASVSVTASGISHLIVIPWLVTRQESVQRIAAEIEYVERVDGISVKVAEPALSHVSLVNLLVANHYGARDYESELDGIVTTKTGAPGDLGKGRRTAHDEFELRQLESRINAMLPSEYQGTYESVKPQSMGTASLKFDDAGKVAWGDIWTSFCDLALAGGPPHRGKLLEAVSSNEALAEPELYQAVVAEIERGIQLVTSLPVVTSDTAGWVGVRCESEEMAVWLMRAIIVENIMVRREGDVLYLPAGPRFTVKREIKNVITAIAKTVHYWSTHLLARQQAAEQSQ